MNQKMYFKIYSLCIFYMLSIIFLIVLLIMFRSSLLHYISYITLILTISTLYYLVFGWLLYVKIKKKIFKKVIQFLFNFLVGLYIIILTGFISEEIKIRLVFSLLIVPSFAIIILFEIRNLKIKLPT